MPTLVSDKRHYWPRSLQRQSESSDSTHLNPFILTLLSLHSKATVSPTDQMQSPCSAKLTSAKKKHFTKYAVFHLSSSPRTRPAHSRCFCLFRGKPASLGSRFMAVAGPETEQDKENAF